MKHVSSKERYIRDFVFRAFPPPQRVCTLCGRPGVMLGVQRVDHLSIGYCLCKECYVPGYETRLSAHIRVCEMQKQRN